MSEIAAAVTAGVAIVFVLLCVAVSFKRQDRAIQADKFRRE